MSIVALLTQYNRVKAVNLSEIVNGIEKFKGTYREMMGNYYDSCINDVLNKVDMRDVFRRD